MKGLKIGIPFDQGDLWQDSSIQSIFNLYDTLSNLNHEIFYLNLRGEPTLNLKGNVLDYNTNYLDMDIIIVCDIIPKTQSIIEFKKNPSKKVIKYINDNLLLNYTESIIHNVDYLSTSSLVKLDVDEIWHTPRNIQMDIDYLETMTGKDVIEVPFIWSEKHLDKSINLIKDKSNVELSYNFRKVKKSIGIFQPNKSIDKSFIIPSLIADSVYKTKTGKDRIHNMSIYSIDSISNTHTVDFLNNLDMYKDNMISFNSRKQIAIGLGMISDIMICHQLQNMDTLSYIYMDAIHMGYPVLHNATDCRNLGYYYDKNNIEKASEKLKDILLNHDSKALKYNTSNRKKLNKYKPENSNIIASYDKLISNIWKNGNSHLNFNKSKNHYV